MVDMLEDIKERCGIAAEITVYDNEIGGYIKDCEADMAASGVPLEEVKEEQLLTAVTLYVKAYIGNDRTDTDKCLKLYRDKVFRLTLEGGEG